jgi:TatD DNase family protein
MFVDSHCHLSFPELAGQIDGIRSAMAQARVERALCICTTLEEFDAVHGLALHHDNFWASVGVHPDSEGVREPGVDDLTQRAALPRVVAIGETGLDYYRLAGRNVASARPWPAACRWWCTRAARRRTPWTSCARSMPSGPAACSTASPRRWRSRARRSTWAFASRFRAS